MKCRIKWLDHMSFVGESESGHSVVMDGAPEGGGRNLGVRPLEMLLLGLGGCTAYDVVAILRKSRQPIVDCEVEIEAQRADDIPRVFTKIHIHYLVSGRDLDAEKVSRAVELTSDKYCSASRMLEKATEITHDFEIVNID